MPMSTKKIRTIEELGEFGLIDHLTKDITKIQESTWKAVGDDAAVINHGTYMQVVTTDLLLEGVHFDLVYTPLKHLGYKAVVANLSDVYAMNAAPRQITVSIGVSPPMSASTGCGTITYPSTGSRKGGRSPMKKRQACRRCFRT